MNTTHDITEAEVRDALLDVGIVRNVTVGDGIEVELMHTFVGCPALEVMKESVLERLAEAAPGVPVNVKVTLDEAWTSDRISERGRQTLKRSGFAPPPLRRDMPSRPSFIQLMPVVECPYCESRDTVVENAFGPTLCRAIFWCNRCRQPFEQFKAV